MCSVDSTSSGNQCTLYEKDSGEILADGLFQTIMTHVSVDKSELQYAAVGHGMIYLQDGKVLEHVSPSERDPSRRKVIGKLEGLAMRGSSQAIDCSRAAAKTPEKSVACAKKSLAEGRAFFLTFYDQGIDSFELVSLAANEAGEAYEVHYKSAWVGERTDIAKNWKVFDDGHTVVIPCPKPVTLFGLSCMPVLRE
jgi:hypothetical protein